jgi:hypothetical protein
MDMSDVLSGRAKLQPQSTRWPAPLPPQQVVKWVKITSAELSKINPDCFEFSPHQGWVFIQRICFWLLNKIGAHKHETTTVYTRSPQQNNSLLQSLVGQEGQWIELIHNNRAKRIYIGPEDNAELQSISDGLGMRPFSFTGRIKTRNGPLEQTWHDIPITVIPWMNGAIIVPDDRDFN